MTGSGTQIDPYIISDVNDLQAMESDLTAYYELSGDIDASATSGWNSGAGFLPIGDGGDFTGYLDGKGYTISSLTINRGSTTNVGLFKVINNTGAYAVRNLTITGTFTARSACGGLAGVVTAGLIDNVHSQVNITAEYASAGFISDIHFDANVTNCSSIGSVTSTATTTRNRFGGFASLIYGAVENCFATGNVTLNATEIDSGGFVGYVASAATVKKCYATGNIVNGSNDKLAGFVGKNVGTIENCYARGSVAGDDAVGGFVGANYSTTTGGTIENCYSTGAPTGNTNVGGLVGDNGGVGTVTNCFWDTESSGEGSSDGGTGKTTDQMKTKSTFTGVGWNFNTIWYFRTDRNDGYPHLGLGYVIRPNQAITRVTNLIHTYVRKEGVYTLTMALGEVTSDFGLPQWLSKPQASTPEGEKKEIYKTVQEAVSSALEQGPVMPGRVIPRPSIVPFLITGPEAEPAPQPGELTERTKRIMETPAAKALETRIAGLKAGVEAVVTPYTIDVLRKSGQKARLLTELQETKRLASQIGITSYTRSVLIKKAIELQRQFKAL